MTIYTEQLESRQSTVDANDTRTAVRVWYVDTADAVAARTNIGEGAPDWRTFPPDPGLRFDRIDTRLAPNGAGTYITARYSTHGNGRLPQPPLQADTNPVTREWSSRRLDVTIPINVRATYVSDEGSADAWQQTELGASDVFPERVLKVKLSGVTSDTIFDAIAAQIGKVHKVRGEALQLMDGTPTRVTESEWNVTYRYLKDLGTKAFALPTRVLYVSPDNRAAVGTDPVSGVNIEEYFRLPFERLTQIQSSDPTVEPHPCISRRPDYVPDGYVQLPGGWLFG